MPCLIGIEMFISATFLGNTVGLPTRLRTGFASSPSSKPLRLAGFSAGAQHSSARGLSFSTMAASVLALTEDSQIVETVRVCADEDAGMHLAVS